MYRSFFWLAIGVLSITNTLNAACCGQDGDSNRSNSGRMYRTSARGIQQRADKSETRELRRSSIHRRGVDRIKDTPGNEEKAHIDNRLPTSFPTGYTPPGGDYTKPPRAHSNDTE